MVPIIATDVDDVFVTADTHLGHGNIIKYCHRPFLWPVDKIELAKLGQWHDGNWKGPKSSQHRISDEGIEIMDNTLIDTINKTVPADATLIHVGDFMLGPRREAAYERYATRCRAYRDRINCRNMRILWGNHDIPWLLPDLFQWDGFVGKIELTKWKKGRKHGNFLVLSHYAHMVWDGSHRGTLHAYGHSHAGIEDGAERTMPGRRCMDVGVDNAAKLLGDYRPFRLQEIIDHLQDKPGFKFNSDIPANYSGPLED